ncbi:MAG: tRNA (adenosine(37)-N6)-threonylcarbamoyltransferase complex dimerization subunit type 1 TsaB [Eubacteriaceae bacterium]
MNILAIDTSTIVASVAIVNEDKLVGEITINHQKKHSEKLLGAIDHLLCDSGFSITDIDMFGIAQGPGSFTGLRIGMATIKGFAQALNKPVIGVSTLEGLAMNLATTRGLICPILDAQRQEVYTGIYYFENGRLVTEMEDSVLKLEKLIERLEETNQEIYFLGDGLTKFSGILLEKLTRGIIAPNHLSMNHASSIAQVALQNAIKGNYMDYKELEPLYIRPSYAEEKKNGN